MTASNPQRRHALLMLVLATLYWGISFPVIKALTILDRRLIPDGGSWFLATSAVAPRFVLAAVVMLVFRRRGEKFATRREWRQGLEIGLFAAGGMLCQTDALQFTDASTSSFLTQFTAILIPVWVAMRSRRNPGAIVWISCVLVLFGVGLLGHFQWQTLRFGRGEWETLLCSIFFMGQILRVEQGDYAGNRPLAATRAMFLVEAVVFAALGMATAPSLHAVAAPCSSTAWVGLTLILAIVSTVGAFSLMNQWQPKITATEAGLIYCVEPIFASVFALFLPGLLSAWALIAYPNEHATGSLVVGGAIITFANVLVQIGPKRAANRGGTVSGRFGTAEFRKSAC
jgi:drug/metabolite transporter (DMT)-like permease